ncbi:unnamed protein product [Symbiodinium sp. CCMP2592]|nr:unnamed protein product [Symbiodinium sp. CCMP2592]
MPRWAPWTPEQVAEVAAETWEETTWNPEPQGQWDDPPALPTAGESTASSSSTPATSWDSAPTTSSRTWYAEVVQMREAWGEMSPGVHSPSCAWDENISLSLQHEILETVTEWPWPGDDHIDLILNYGYDEAKKHYLDLEHNDPIPDQMHSKTQVTIWDYVTMS